jgi:HSP20 family molecular chaperone IbpA
MSSRIEIQRCPPSETIVRRIANREGVDPTELEPLYDVIDLETLDRLTGETAGTDSDVQIGFTYRGYEVTVTGEGVIHIHEKPLSST